MINLTWEFYHNSNLSPTRVEILYYQSPIQAGVLGAMISTPHSGGASAKYSFGYPLDTMLYTTIYICNGKYRIRIEVEVFDSVDPSLSMFGAFFLNSGSKRLGHSLDQSKGYKT